jgi:type I restriction-modification system DNA methylase subunit
MDKLGRYYTTDVFSNLLIKQFTNESPKSIIDLGVGGGSLIRAAVKRWIKTSYYAADIDKTSINKIKKELPFVNTFHLDTLKENISSKLNIKNNSIDIAICNPPYSIVAKDKDNYNPLFDKAQLGKCKQLKILTSDIIFLAKNLQLLKKSGEIGIILPDSLLTGKEFELLRYSILDSHNLKGIIELPEKIFAKTEALTHILIIEKSNQSKSSVPLFLADKKGKIIDQVDVNKESLSERMDFKFHLWKKNVLKKRKTFLTLGKIKAEIKRGNFTHKILKKTCNSYIHTTNIENCNSKQEVEFHKSKNIKCFEAEQGDILIARVGRGCIGKVCMIKKGKAVISDCVYRIRVPNKYRKKVWIALTSLNGQKWMKANSHGVCAKVISKKDLLNFPIF